MNVRQQFDRVAIINLPESVERRREAILEFMGAGRSLDQETAMLNLSCDLPVIRMEERSTISGRYRHSECRTPMVDTCQKRFAHGPASSGDPGYVTAAFSFHQGYTSGEKCFQKIS